MWHVATDVSSVVSVDLSLCNDREPCKNGWTDQDAFLDMDLGGPKESMLDRGPDPHT